MRVSEDSVDTFRQLLYTDREEVNHMSRQFVIKGDLCWSESKDKLVTMDNGCIAVSDGVIEGVFKDLPDKYSDWRMIDSGNDLIIPGMSDLHVHAAQYMYRGLGMDMELLDWLETYAFPEEAGFEDVDYATEVYKKFTADLVRSATTRAVVFASLHHPATEVLMDLLEKSGLVAYVGKVNMDRNSPEYYCETTGQSLRDTETWIKDTISRYERVRPILTPRFTPTCSDELMEGLGDLQRRYGLAVQSHLSENPSECDWVEDLCPWSVHYIDTYTEPGLVGPDIKSVMAHCVYSDEEERRKLKDNHVFVAHCPQSNENVASGIAPVRRFLEEGLEVGMGTDVAGGATLSMLRCIQDALAVSKLRWRLIDQDDKPLTTDETFYLATEGGGRFFGKVGTFKPGYEFDALVISDFHLDGPRKYSLKERLERMIYSSEPILEGMEMKFVRGVNILE